MATAGDPPAAESAYKAAARAGGKFRKRPYRKHQTTPYDRPPTALRSTHRDGWLSKVVDPASKLITSAANKIFASVFRKRLLPPPQHSPAGQSRDPRDNQPELALSEGPPAVCKAGDKESHNPAKNLNSNGVTELEHLLKQKTFTRSEIDRLSAVLHAKVADTTVVAAEERCNGKAEDPPVNHVEQRELVRAQENKMLGGLSTTIMGSKDSRDDAASPAELAKAYMVERSVKASPLMIGWQSQAHREELPMLSDVPFHPRSPSLSMAPKTRSSIETNENGFLTPHPRGRSSIYSMARTPYSRVPSFTPYKGSGAVVHPHSNSTSSTSSQNAAENIQFNESKKLILKRRSSALESDIGTVGPIRRIRQKPNLLSSKNLALPASQSSTASQGTPAVSNGGENALRIAKDTHVSSRSSEMGKKILETLETLTPPKEKSSLKKQDTVEGGQRIEMTPSMLSGQALKSLEKVESFEGFLKIGNDKKMNDLKDSASHHGPSSSYNNQQCVDPNKSQKKLTESSDTVHTDNVRFSNGDASPSAKAITSANPMVSTDVPKKRRTFQMSAHEDFVELDDDFQPKEVASRSIVKDNAHASTAALDNGIKMDKPELLPNTSFPTSTTSGLALSPLNNSGRLESVSNNDTDEWGTSVTLPSSSVSSAVLPTAFVPQSTFERKVAPPTEGNAAAAASVFNTENKGSLFSLSSTSSAVELSNSKDAITESARRITDPSAVSEPPGEESAVSYAAKAPVNLFGKSDNSTASLLPGSVSSTSSVSIMTANDTTKNGPLVSGSGTSGVYSPALISGSLHQSVSNGFMPPSTSPTNAPAAVSGASPIPSFSAGSIFAFGSSGVSSSSSAGSGLNIKDSAFSNQSGTAASSPANVRTGVFSFSSISAGLKNSEVGKPVSCFQNSLASTLQSVPSNLSTSSSIPAVGSHVSSTSGAGSSLFGSSTASGPAFVSSSSGPSSLTQSFSTSGGAVSGLFGSVSQPSNGTSSGSVFNSSSSLSTGFASHSGPSQTAGFTFGASSSASPASSSAPSQSTGFCFGASGPSPTSGNASSLSNSFPFSASSGANPLNNNVPSQSTGFAFGASTGSSASSTLAPSQSAGFIFGASSGSGPTSNTSQSQPAGFSFGLSAGSGSISNGTAPLAFGSAGSLFSFTSAVPAPTISSPLTSASQPAFPFGSTPPVGNNDQMSMEDTMAEDSVQSSTPPGPVFGQSQMSQPSTTGFAFQSGGNPFQFGAPQSQLTSQNSSPFQPSSSLDFSAGTGSGAGGGGSFSLGAGGGDKAGRKIYRVKRLPRKK